MSQAPRDQDNTRRQTPPNRGRQVNCTTQWRVLVFGNPDSGYFTFDLTGPDDDGVNSTASITVYFDDSPTDLATALATHPNLTSDQIVTGSPGGDLPNQELWFRFRNGRNSTDFTVSNISASNLVTSANDVETPYVALRQCCGRNL